MIPRDARERLCRLWKEFPVVLVSGARQVGKTTLAEMLAARLGIDQRASFDSLGTRERAADDPELFVQGLKLPAFLDEAQKVPVLFDAVKQVVDRRPSPGQFLLSGSANFLLLKRVSESLAGRAVRLFLRGISLRELLGKIEKPPHLTEALKASSARAMLDLVHGNSSRAEWSVKDWCSRILAGRFPVLASRRVTDSFRISWMESYVDAFIQKDLADLGTVQSQVEFRRFWRMAASASAQLRDFSALGAALGISYHTASRYLDLLEQGCHLFRLEPYHANLGKRLTKSPRIFSEDTGLALYLSGIRTLEQLEASERRGAWLENFVVAELKTLVELHTPEAQLWFWRTLAGAEVDLVVEAGRRILPIEVKWSSRPSRGELRALETFLHDFKAHAPFGLVACAVTEPFLVTEKIVAIPLGWILF